MAKREKRQRTVWREVLKYGAVLFIFIGRMEEARTEVLKLDETDVIKEVGSQEVHGIGVRVLEP